MIKNRIILRNKFFESAVMICIANIDGKDCFVLEKRAKNIRQGGEVSFPGGKKDKEDKNFYQTAIRETIEELRIEKNNIIKVQKFGTMVFGIGGLIECYFCKLNIEDINKIDYNKAEVESLLIIPIEFFMTTKPNIEKIEIWNKVKFKIDKYNFPKKYADDWKFPDREIYVYMYGEQPIWGITAEIILDFITILKEKGKVGNYEYK